MRTTILLLGALALAPTLAVASEPPTTEDLMVRVLAAQRFSRVAGRFTQSTARLDEPDKALSVFHAQFALQSPDRYDLTYANPRDDQYRLRLCSDGTRRWRIERFAEGEPPDVKEEKVAGAAGGDGPGGPDGDLMRRVTELLRLDPVAITRDFTVQAQPTGDGARVLLVPKAAALAEHVQRIEVDLDAQLRTHELRIDDTRGNRVTVTIEAADYDGELPPGSFTYTP